MQSQSKPSKIQTRKSYAYSDPAGNGSRRYLSSPSILALSFFQCGHSVDSIFIRSKISLTVGHSNEIWSGPVILSHPFFRLGVKVNRGVTIAGATPVPFHAAYNYVVRENVGPRQIRLNERPAMISDHCHRRGQNTLRNSIQPLKQDHEFWENCGCENAIGIDHSLSSDARALNPGTEKRGGSGSASPGHLTSYRAEQ
jgi:hypothetical protein